MDEKLHSVLRGAGRGAIAFALALGLNLSAALAEAPVFELVTPEEAAAARLAEDEALPDDAIPTLRTNAPRIVVRAPVLNARIPSPVDIRVEFIPASGARVRFETLRVRYRIGPIWTDVTGRIVPHATVSGNVLTARGAQLPEGRHTLRVEITDSANRTGAGVFSFTVD